MDLIDYSKLTDFLTLLKKRVEEHEASFLELKLMQQQQADTASVQGKEISNLNELTVSFRHGLDELHAMVDKVNAWNERFRMIEERNYQIYRDLNDVSVGLQGQIDALRDNIEASNSEVFNKLQAEILRKHGEGEKNLGSRCKDLEEDLETFKLEQTIGVERLQRDLSSQIKGVYDFMGVSSPSPTTTHDSYFAEAASLLPSTPSGEAGRANPLKTLSIKVANLERRLFITPLSEQDQHDPSQPQSRDDVLFEMNHRFAYLSKEVDSLKNLIAIAQSSESHPHAKVPVMESYVSLVDKINDLSKLREAAPTLLRLEQRVINLTESMNELSEKSRANEISTSSFNRQGSLVPQRTIELSRQADMQSPGLRNQSVDIPEVNPTEASSDSKTAEHEQRFAELYETLNKVMRSLPQLVNISEFDEISSQVKKIVKDRQREAARALDLDNTAKLDEIEQRLNKLWKQNYDIANLVQQITTQVERSSAELLEQQDNKLEDVTIKVHSTQSELKHQLDSVVKNIRQMASDFEAKELSNTEQFLKNQIMNLKRDLQVTEERLERMEAKMVSSAAILNDSIEDIDEGSIQSMNSLQKFQAVLNHHDKSIRMLASRINVSPIFEETKAKTMQAADVLGHLEDLRMEMHELQTKYDTNKTLSAKELEKLNEIYSLLSTKSDRQELVRKVDKTELKRIERLLKKQIEKVNEALKKAEDVTQPNVRDDAFFLKKRLDVDCASCGQILPNYHEHALQFAPKERFPIRSAMFGPGFSRLLASLVPGENGGMTLPRKSTSQIMNTSDFRSPNSSPPHSMQASRGTTTVHALKRRLPKLGSKGSG
jgi:hypothetical protein